MLKTIAVTNQAYNTRYAYPILWFKLQLLHVVSNNPVWCLLLGQLGSSFMKKQDWGVETCRERNVSSEITLSN